MPNKILSNNKSIDTNSLRKFSYGKKIGIISGLFFVALGIGLIYSDKFLIHFSNGLVSNITNYKYVGVPSIIFGLYLLSKGRNSFFKCKKNIEKITTENSHNNFTASIKKEKLETRYPDTKNNQKSIHAGLESFTHGDPLPDLDRNKPSDSAINHTNLDPCCSKQPAELFSSDLVEVNKIDSIIDEEEFNKIVMQLKSWLLNGVSKNLVEGYLQHFLNKCQISIDELTLDMNTYGDHSIKWQKIVEKLRKTNIKILPFLRAGQEIKWVTGSRSSSLIGIDEVAHKSSSQLNYSLIPTGILINKYKIVPVTGELAWGILDRKGANNHSLSGVRLAFIDGAFKYATDASFLFSPKYEKELILQYQYIPSIGLTNRLLVAVLRLIRYPSEEIDLQTLKEHIQNNILPQFPEEDLESVIYSAYMQNLLPSELDDDSMNDYDSYQKAQAIWLRMDEEARTQIEISMIPRKKIEFILSLFETEKESLLSDEDKSYLNESFPIIWGGTDLGDRCHFTHGTSTKGEVSIKGSVALGNEIQAVFVKKRNILKIQPFPLGF